MCKRKSFFNINYKTTHEYQNPFRLKEDNLSQRNCQNQLSHPDLSHTDKERQKSLIQGKIWNQQNLNEGTEYS